MYCARVTHATISTSLTPTRVTGGHFSFFFTNTSANPPSFPQILSTQPSASSGLSIVYFDPHFQLPQVHETDLTIEREIATNTVVSVSYMGSFGRSLPDFVDTNTGPAVT